MSPARKSRDAFRTITEVGDLLAIEHHVLRYWESQFRQIKPVKRSGNRRHYRPADIELISGLKKLLHEDNVTIRAARKILHEKGIKFVAGLGARIDWDDISPDVDSTDPVRRVDTRTTGAGIADQSLFGNDAKPGEVAAAPAGDRKPHATKISSPDPAGEPLALDPKSQQRLAELLARLEEIRDRNVADISLLGSKIALASTRQS